MRFNLTNNNPPGLRYAGSAKEISMLRTTLIAASIVLSGCEVRSGDAGPLRGCDPISGGGTAVASAVSPTCTGCAVTDAGSAIDGNGDTYATLGMPSGASGSVALRATAQPGVVFPAGSRVGMVHSIAYGASTGVQIILRTYADGVEQEEFPMVVSGAGTSAGDPEDPGRISAATSAQYDTVELEFSRVSGTGVVEARVHAFCSN